MKHVIRRAFFLIAVVPIFWACSSTAPTTSSYGVGVYTDSLMQALRYVMTLSKSGNLPGFQKEDHATAKLNYGLKSDGSEPPTFNFPISVEAEVVKDTENEFVYHYLLNKQGFNEPWVVVKAWKTDGNGKVVEDNLKFPLPDIQRQISRDSKL